MTAVEILVADLQRNTYSGNDQNIICSTAVLIAALQELAAGAGGGMTQLTGDVLAGPGGGSQAATIAALAVTTGKIAATAVTTAKIADANVTTAKIADANVTLAKIANAAANSVLLGSGAAGIGIPYAELSLGTNLSMSGTTLNAAGGSSGAKILISEVVTSGSAGSVTFSGIANTYRDLEVRLRARGDTAATSISLLMQYNGDTGANYDYITENRFGAGFGNASTSILINNIDAATATASYETGIIINIYDYKGTTFFKSADAQGWLLTNQAGAAGMFENRNAGWWRNTAAITAVKVFPSAGNFVDNSVISLYGNT